MFIISEIANKDIDVPITDIRYHESKKNKKLNNFTVLFLSVISIDRVLGK